MSRFLPKLPVILCIAFLLRAIWALLIAVDPISDSAAYAVFATNIAEYGVYGFEPDAPGAYWAVGPAALYAAAYLVFGIGSGFGVVLVNMISSLAVVALLYHLGRRWFGETEGRIAALLFALWPLAIQFTTVLASELHFMALSLAGLAAWEQASRKVPNIGMSVPWFVLAGLMFGLATYIRPIALLLPAALALAALLRAPRKAIPPVLGAVLCTVLIYATVAPWSARNERVFGEPVFMSTNFWANFWMGNHPGTSGEYTPLPPEVEGKSELERAEILRELSLESLEDNPTGLVTRTLWKMLKLHERETIGVSWNEVNIEALIGAEGVTLAKLLSTGWWYLMLAFALVGIAILIRRIGLWHAILCTPVWLWAYFTGVHAVIVVGDRYHMPAIPMIAVLAAVTLASLLQRGGEHDQDR